MSTKHRVTGTVHHVGPIEQIGSKGFQKRTFTLAEGNDKFANNVPYELHKDEAERAPSPGDKVALEFYLQGREWQGKHYLSAKCVDWELVESKPKSDVPAFIEKPRMANEPQPEDDESRLPF